jgi:hypothetical protein
MLLLKFKVNLTRGYLLNCQRTKSDSTSDSTKSTRHFLNGRSHQIQTTSSIQPNKKRAGKNSQLVRPTFYAPFPFRQQRTDKIFNFLPKPQSTTRQFHHSGYSILITKNQKLNGLDPNQGKVLFPLHRILARGLLIFFGEFFKKEMRANLATISSRSTPDFATNSAKNLDSSRGEKAVETDNCYRLLI